MSAYIIIGLMFASSFAAVNYLSTSDFFADNEPANTQTFQYFSFTTLTTLGYGELHPRRRAAAVPSRSWRR